MGPSLAARSWPKALEADDSTTRADINSASVRFISVLLQPWEFTAGCGYNDAHRGNFADANRFSARRCETARDPDDAGDGRCAGSGEVHRLGGAVARRRSTL